MVEHKHLMVQASTPLPPKDVEATEKWVLGLIYNLGMKPLIHPKAVYCDTVGNRGMTCISAIETSHIVIHAWDEGEIGEIQLDVYTCAELDLDVVYKTLMDFKAYKLRYKFYDRKNGFKLISDHKPVNDVLGELECAVWHFAKTMPTIPHWYTRRREWQRPDLFVDAVELIDKQGEIKEFMGKYYKYLHHDGFKYWTMERDDVPYSAHILINRAKE